MSTAWKKKTYGPVKPVKPAKITKPTKPSVLALKAIFKSIDTAINGMHIDALSHALYWWQSSLLYIKSKRPHETLEVTRALLSAFDWTKRGQSAMDNKEKERCFISALDAYRKYAKVVILTPPVASHIKAMRVNLVKHKDENKTLGAKYDKLLVMLSQCFSSAPFNFEVVPQCFSISSNVEIPCKLDHAVQKFFISKKFAIQLTKDIRKNGLLPVAIDVGFKISRAMSFVGTNQGKFLVDTAKHLDNYHDLMKDVALFAASNPEAPRQLVKKTFKRPKKSKSKKSVTVADFHKDDVLGEDDGTDD